MRAKQLENYFREYQLANPTPVEDEGVSAIIYTKEDFHVNTKQKTVYVKDIGVISTPDLSVGNELPDWVAICINPKEVELAQIVMGTGNPYVDEYRDVLPNSNGVIVAIPNSVRLKYLKMTGQLKK